MNPQNILEPYDVQFLELVRHVINSPCVDHCVRSSHPSEIITIQLEEEFPLLKAMKMNVDVIKEGICSLIRHERQSISEIMEVLAVDQSITQTWSRSWDSCGDPDVDEDFIGLLRDTDSDVISLVRSGSSLNMTVVLPGDIHSIPGYIAVYSGIAKLIAFKLGIVAETITAVIIGPCEKEYNFDDCKRLYENLVSLENLSYLSKDFIDELSCVSKETPNGRLATAIRCIDTYPKFSINVSPDIDIDEICESDISIDEYVHI